MLDRFRIRLSGLAPVAIRISLGAVFIFHGCDKFKTLLGGGNPVGELVANWPVPALWGWAAGLTEFIGGICVALGLLTRFWSAGMVILMSVAVFVVHWGQFDIRQGGFEYPFSLGMAALALFLMGPGPISLDYVLGRLFRGPRANPVVGTICPLPGQQVSPQAVRPPTVVRPPAVPPL